MKILYVTNRLIDKRSQLSYLESFAEYDDIKVVGIEEAMASINSDLLKGQAHIDFILVDYINVEDFPRDKLAMAIRVNPGIYSSQNFKLSSIPIILIKEVDRMDPTNEPVWYDKIIYRTHENDIKVRIIGDALTQWMQKIGDDLSHLELDLDLNFQPSKIEWLISHRGFKLKILTEEFLRSKRKLEYVWFGNNLTKLDISINKFYELLKKAERMPHLRNEKEIHQYFLNNQKILLGEFYRKTFYEQQYYLQNSKRYVEPDFTNLAYSFYQQSPEIFEIKLPTQRFVRINGQSLYSNASKSLNQVALKYAGFFGDSLNCPEIEKRIGYKGNAFNYTLLMGRKADKEENVHFINSAFKGHGIKLITYDELPDNFQKLYERTIKYCLR